MQRVFAAGVFASRLHRNMAAWFAAILIAGCASPTVQVQPAATVLPPIRLFIDDGMASNNLFSYRNEIATAIKESGVFESINAEATSDRVELYLSLIENNKTSDAYKITAAATLFVLPIPHDVTFCLQARVYGPLGVKHYTFEDRRKWSSNVLGLFAAGAPDIAEWRSGTLNVVNRFLNEVQVNSPLVPAKPKPLDT